MSRISRAFTVILTAMLGSCTDGPPLAPDDVLVDAGPSDAGQTVGTGPTCPDDQTPCEGVCVDTGTSLFDCGACGNTCPTRGACTAGACSCPEGLMTCGDTCADLMTDGSNCGACTVNCLAPLTACSSGVCVCPDQGLLCEDSCCPAGSSCADGADWAQWPIPPDAPPDSEYAASTDGTVVTDTVTGLMWQRDVPPNPCPSDGTDSCTQSDAATYCDHLSLGGYTTNWRLPTMIELLSISDLAAGSPAINGTAFPDTPWNGLFWTSTPDATMPNTQWDVSFDEGDPEALPSTGLVRCVRAPTSAPACAGPDGAPIGRYSAGDGTVLDTTTQLTWQRTVSSATYPWSRNAASGSAQAYCQTLTLGGVSGWRLPSVKELMSIVDLKSGTPAIDPSVFPTSGMGDWPFWSSTLNAMNEGGAWAVNFKDGVANYYVSISADLNVRCVR